MIKRLVVEGRLAWPPVIAIILMAFTVLFVDFIWRVSTISGEATVMMAVLFFVSEVGLVLGASYLIRRRRGARNT